MFLRCLHKFVYKFAEALCYTERNADLLFLFANRFLNAGKLELVAKPRVCLHKR